MYVRDEVAEVVRHIRELKGFKQIKLGDRDSKVVKFKLTEEDLAYYHSNGELYADEGSFTVYVGENYNTENKITFKLI